MFTVFCLRKKNDIVFFGLNLKDLKRCRVVDIVSPNYHLIFTFAISKQVLKKENEDAVRRQIITQTHFLAACKACIQIKIKNDNSAIVP